MKSLTLKETIMKRLSTILVLWLLAASCVDNGYDLSAIDTDDVGIGDEHSIFTCPLMTLRVAVGDISNERGDLDRILGEADVWLPDRLPDDAEAVDVATLTGVNGAQRQEAYLSGPEGLLTALLREIDADPSGGKLDRIARRIYADYKTEFLPDYLPADAREEEYVAAFGAFYRQPATRELIRESIASFAARYLTTGLNMDVQPFVLSGIDVGADVRDMITGGDGSQVSLSLFGTISTDLPVDFSAHPAFQTVEAGRDRTLVSFPSFTVRSTADAPTRIEETKIASEALSVIFEQETRIVLNVRLESYYPRRPLGAEQGITVDLKIRRRGGLTLNL